MYIKLQFVTIMDIPGSELSRLTKHIYGSCKTKIYDYVPRFDRVVDDRWEDLSLIFRVDIVMKTWVWAVPQW